MIGVTEYELTGSTKGVALCFGTFLGAHTDGSVFGVGPLKYDTATCVRLDAVGSALPITVLM